MGQEVKEQEANGEKQLEPRRWEYWVPRQTYTDPSTGRLVFGRVPRRDPPYDPHEYF